MTIHATRDVTHSVVVHQRQLICRCNQEVVGVALVLVVMHNLQRNDTLLVIRLKLVVSLETASYKS